MAFNSTPWGNATSFSGIPLTQTQQAPQNPIYNQGDIVPAFGGPGIQYNTTPNPITTGLMADVQGEAGMLNQAGTGAVGAAQANQQQIQGLAGGLAALGGQVSKEFAGNTAWANQELSTAFDPNSSAYNYYKTMQQNQVGAQAGQAGYGNTPYAGEVQGASNAAFDNAWQTAQVGREAQGAAGAAGLQGQELNAQLGGGALINEAGQLDQGAMNSLLSAYGLQGQDLAAAGGLLAQIFGDLGVTVQGAGGAALTSIPA